MTPTPTLRDTDADAGGSTIALLIYKYIVELKSSKVDTILQRAMLEIKLCSILINWKSFDSMNMSLTDNERDIIMLKIFSEHFNKIL